MKESIKANLIVFLIIATIAFGISLTIASLTIHDNHDSYKLTSIENDSFEPGYIYKVQTVKPKNTTNTTNTTIVNVTKNITTDNDSNDLEDILENIIEKQDEED